MIATERLVLRPWEDRDCVPYAAMLAEPHMIEFLGPVVANGAQSVMDRHIGYRTSHGLGFWAVERRADGALLGQCGLKPGGERTPIAGMLEIGWALGSVGLGQGFAVEAARASLTWAWANRSEDEVVAITSAINTRSRAVMERLGMTHDPAATFDHPAVADDSSLKRHIIYRIARPAER